MIIEQGLTVFLTTYPPLMDLQGTRLYPDNLPQSPTLPATVYQRISGVVDYSQSGQSEPQNARFQFTCWAVDPLAAKLLARVLKTAVSGYRGLMGTVEIQEAFVENETGGQEPDTGLYREIVDVIFGFKEA